MAEPLAASPYATLADFHFSASFNPKGCFVRFAGPEGFFDATLLKGALNGQIGFGLSLLGRPSGLVARVQRYRWTITTPKRSPFHPGVAAKPHPEKGTYRNMGRLRRILEIRGPEVAVLRFNRQIPRRLKLALKALFEGAEYPLKMLSGVTSAADDDETDTPDTEESNGREDLEEDRPPAEDGDESQAGAGEGRRLDAEHGEEGRDDQGGSRPSLGEEVEGGGHASLPTGSLEG